MTCAVSPRASHMYCAPLGTEFHCPQPRTIKQLPLKLTSFPLAEWLLSPTGTCPIQNGLHGDMVAALLSQAYKASFLFVFNSVKSPKQNS